MEEKINKKEGEGFFKFFELHTEYGPLYLYEKYSRDPDKAGNFDKEMPVTREFFTNEEGIRGYCTIDFMDRTAVFTTTEMSMEGFPREHYMEELQPYDFLMKVGPYIENDQDKQEKAREVYDIFRYKREKVCNSRIIRREREVSKKTKNEVAKQLLKKYTL